MGVVCEPFRERVEADKEKRYGRKIEAEGV